MNLLLHPWVSNVVAEVSETKILPMKGDWDLLSFFKNAKSYAMTVGGAFIALVGLVIIIVAGFFIARKFMGGQSAQQDSWVKIVIMILVGGALMAGGITLLVNIAQGGKGTVEDLGGM